MRKVVLGALEVERKAGRIKSALETHPVVYVQDIDMHESLAGIDLAELCITAECDLSAEAAPAEAFRLNPDDAIAVVIAPAQGEKCARCWKVTTPATGLAYEEPLCSRCVGVLRRDFNVA